MCCCFFASLGGRSRAAGGSSSGRWEPRGRGSSALLTLTADSPVQQRRAWGVGRGLSPSPKSAWVCGRGSRELSCHWGSARTEAHVPARGTLWRGYPVSSGYRTLSSVSEPQYPHLQNRGTTTGGLRSSGARGRPASPARERGPGPRGGGRGARRGRMPAGFEGEARRVGEAQRCTPRGWLAPSRGWRGHPAVCLNSATPGGGSALRRRPCGRWRRERSLGSASGGRRAAPISRAHARPGSTRTRVRWAAGARHPSQAAT